MEYVTIFDVQELRQPASLIMSQGFAILGGILTCVGLVAFFLGGRSRISWLLVPPLFLVIGLSMYWDSKHTIGHYRDMLRTGTAARIEGTVDKFDVRPDTGHKLGLLSIGGHTFPYDDYDITQALWTASEPRGRLRVGCYVRIWHDEAQILKLEMLSNCEREVRNASGAAR